LTGCFGGLENDPFLPGVTEIRGTLEGPIDTATAFVSVAGHPDLESSVGADGAFEIRGVPSGDVEIIASTGLGRATRQTAHAFHERPLVLALFGQPALMIAGRVALEDAFADSFETRVRVEGLPVVAAVDSDGRYALDNLPFGCHRLIAEHEGFESHTIESCGAAGEMIFTHHPLRHAGAHLSLACAPCDDHAQCASGLCVASGVEQVCADRCDAMNHPCGQPFACVDGACLLPHASCAALADLLHLAHCESDASCGLEGESDGVCIPGHNCTIACTSDHECPAGHPCATGSTPSVCH
jgi:hypothetical protein